MFNLMMPCLNFRDGAVFCGEGGGEGGGASDGPTGKSSNSANKGMGASVSPSGGNAPSFSSRPQSRPAGLDTSAERSAAGKAMQAAAPTVDPSGGLFGYDSVGDMVDGGGPMAEGNTFGGRLGGISNSLGATPYGSGIDASGFAGAVSSPMGRAAIGALTGGLPGAVTGYAAATHADKSRDGRDPDKGFLGMEFGNNQSTDTSNVGMGGERPEKDTAVSASDPCPEGYVYDQEQLMCVIDTDIGVDFNTDFNTDFVPRPAIDYRLPNPMDVSRGGTSNYTQQVGNFIPTPLQPVAPNPIQQQLNQLSRAMGAPPQQQQRPSGLAGAITGIMQARP